MNVELKKRINAINSGTVPEGYKKTKAGIVPIDWEEKRIKDYLTLTERPITLNDSIEYELVTVRRAFGGVDSRGKQLGKNILVKNYFQLQNNDFVISKRQIAHGACGIVPQHLSEAVVSNEYNVFTAKNGLDIGFFSLLMQHPYYKRLFYLMSDGVHIEKLLFKTKDWMKRKIALPPLPEQQKIAEILSTQDKLIALQEKKIEQLKELKKAYLQKMFPQKGSQYPELRFKGFTDAWEQRKLGECVTFLDTMRKPLKESEREKGIYPYYGASGIVDYVSDYIFDEELVLLSEDGANITDRNYPVCFLASGKYWVNNHAHVLKVNAENENNFICNSLERMDFTQYNSGMAMPKLNKDVCHNIPLFCPIYEEQKQIGDFFRNLDNLITLHQHKLEQEKQKKKALMQLLLTGKVRVKP